MIRLKGIILLLSLLLLTACQSKEEEPQQSQVAVTQEDQSMDQVNEEEGIDAEQIVVKITDDGFICSHDDHFHSYNGKLPEDAFWAKSLLVDDDYELRAEDIVSDHKDGHVIKLDGEYYFYCQDPSQAKYMRESDLLDEKESSQEKQAGQQDLPAPQNRNEKGEYTTSDGYIYHPEDVEEDLGDGFMVTHEDHKHYIPKSHLTEEEVQAGIDHLGGN